MSIQNTQMSSGFGMLEKENHHQVITFFLLQGKTWQDQLLVFYESL